MSKFPLYLLAAFLALQSFHNADAAKVTLYDKYNFRGNKLELEVVGTTCVDLPSTWVGTATSVSTKARCAQLYDGLGCSGRFVCTAAGKAHKRLDWVSFDNKTASVRLCTKAEEAYCTYPGDQPEASTQDNQPIDVSTAAPGPIDHSSPDPYQPSSSAPDPWQPSSEQPQPWNPTSEGPDTWNPWNPTSEGPDTWNPTSEGPDTWNPWNPTSEGPDTWNPWNPTSEGPDTWNPWNPTSEGPDTWNPWNPTSEGPDTWNPWNPTSEGPDTWNPSNPTSEGPDTWQPTSDNPGPIHHSTQSPIDHSTQQPVKPKPTKPGCQWPHNMNAYNQHWLHYASNILSCVQQYLGQLQIPVPVIGR